MIDQDDVIDMIEKIPLSAFSLVLSFATLSKISLMYSYTVLFWIFFISSILIFVLITLKFIIHRDIIRIEAEKPVALAMLSLFPMSLVVLNSYLLDKNILMSTVLWFFSFLMFVVISAEFFARVIHKKKWDFVLPTIFVNYVGIDVLIFNRPSFLPIEIMHAILGYSIIAYVISVVVVTFLLIKKRNLNELTYPTLAIYAAPSSLITVSFLSLGLDVPVGFIILLFVLNLIGLLIYLFTFITANFISFEPTFGAFTFPIVINCLAFIRISDIYISPYYNLDLIENGFFFVAVGFVVYILYRYVKFCIDVRYNIND